MAMAIAMNGMDDLVLGFDGGGTRTVALLASRRSDGSWNVLGRGEAGPSNRQAVGTPIGARSAGSGGGGRFHGRWQAAKTSAGRVSRAGRCRALDGSRSGAGVGRAHQAGSSGGCDRGCCPPSRSGYSGRSWSRGRGGHGLDGLRPRRRWANRSRWRLGTASGR